MAERTIIPGPPGTGKTFRLLNHYMKQEISERKTDTKKIIYITFSKAAAKEAEGRIEELFPGVELKYVSTMHAMGAKETKINTKDKLLKGISQWNQFKLYEPRAKSLNVRSALDEFSGQTRYEDPILQVRNYAISKKITLEEAAVQCGYIAWNNIDLAHQIDASLKKYKEATGMIEFHDMITKFIDRIKTDETFFSSDVVFLDEAQDLNPLQWEMFFAIEKKSKRSYIAGDDDQTIYGFQGAEPEIFINLKGTLDPQEESRRVPKLVHNVATDILSRIGVRREKKWKPRDEEGEVHRNVRIEDIDFTKQNWMILGKTNKLAMLAADYLYHKGYRYDSKSSEHLPKDNLKAYRTWVNLNNGSSVDTKDVKTMYSFLKVKKNHIERGFSSGKSFQNLYTVNIDELKSSHGLLVSGDWNQLDFSDEIKDYMAHLIKQGDDLMQESRIEITTIHQSKGRECENVVLFCDFGHEEAASFLYSQYEKKPDETHRLFFVGTTRAKQRLFILQPETPYSYDI
tara:strand:+ start:10522 stop:12063 length:1542 start_codon:yes stop_codon:yes gene_type:complete